MKKEIVIGIDIGGTNSVFGLVDKNGEIITNGQLSTCDFSTPEELVNVLSEKLNGYLKELSDQYELKGIGIGAPNGNHFDGTIKNAPNLKWKGIVPLVDLFKKNFDVTVTLTNDANAAALGEMFFGGAQKMKNFIVLTLGTGLGSGIIVNGNLLYGHDSFAGELGHVFVYPNKGRVCGCGRRGCLETYVSAQGIKRTVLELLAEYTIPSELRKVPENKITAESIFEAAKRGDEIANKAFDITGKYLGTKLADFIATTSPECVFLYGGLANAGDLILRPTRKYMEEFVFNQYKNKVKVLLSELNENKGALLGAAALVWKLKKQAD